MPTAIFRGNSTGPGVDESNNQRIKLTLISKMWKADARYNDRNPVMRMPHLLGSLLHLNSVGSVWPVCLPAIMSCLSCPGGSHPVSGRGCRRVERSRSQNPGLSDDVHQPQGTVWLCVRLVALIARPCWMFLAIVAMCQEQRVTKVPKVPMYEQQKFKYQIYADGHVAAMRYTSMMVLGSVIFKVQYRAAVGVLQCAAVGEVDLGTCAPCLYVRIVWPLHSWCSSPCW